MWPEPICFQVHAGSCMILYQHLNNNSKPGNEQKQRAVPQEQELHTRNIINFGMCYTLKRGFSVLTFQINALFQVWGEFPPKDNFVLGYLLDLLNWQQCLAENPEMNMLCR